jgi:ketosteroid isomerase-like protein
MAAEIITDAAPFSPPGDNMGLPRHSIADQWEPMSPAVDTPRKHLEFIFSATARGDWKFFVDALAEDAEWTVIGSTGWSKTYRGKSQILSDLFAPLRRVLAPPRTSHAVFMIAEGNMVAVQGQGRNTTRDGRKYENTYCWIFAFRDGQVAAVTEYADTELMRSVLGEPPRLPADASASAGRS